MPTLPFRMELVHAKTARIARLAIIPTDNAQLALLAINSTTLPVSPAQTTLSPLAAAILVNLAHVLLVLPPTVLV